MTKQHILKEQETIIKSRCIIAACGQEMSAEFESTKPLERAGCKITTVCDNGVGFKHVVTSSGKHYGIRDKNFFD